MPACVACVVIGYAEALGILVEQKSIVAGRAVEVRTVVGVVFVVFLNVGAKLLEQLARSLLHKLLVCGFWLRVLCHLQIHPVHVGELAACSLNLLYRVCHVSRLLVIFL